VSILATAKDFIRRQKAFCPSRKGPIVVDLTFQTLTSVLVSPDGEVSRRYSLTTAAKPLYLDQISPRVTLNSRATPSLTTIV
jgi:hypothetical protein